MIKSLLVASALCLTLTAPAFAGSGGCDDNDAWLKLETEINAMPAGAEKDATMAEWKLAGEAKTASNMNECDNRMSGAKDTMGKKK